MRNIRLSVLAFLVVCASSALAQKVNKTDSIQGGNDKVEKNRNVMLNAASASGPRNVNIGLPASVGGITILENDLPVVYYFWPELPTKTWRGSNSLDKMGLLKLSELAMTVGDLGYAVNSYSCTGKDKTEIIGTIGLNNYGYYKSDINLSGKIAKNWYYSVGAYLTGDPGEADYDFGSYVDQTKIYRAVLTRRFDNNRGEISLGYKYTKSYSVTNYAPFIFNEGGEADEYNGFKIGSDSYVLNTGIFHLKNSLTGEAYTANLNKDGWSSSNTVDLFGNYLLNNGWDFKFSNRLHTAKATVLYATPTAVSSVGSNAYTYMDGTAYTGDYVQGIMVMSSPKIPTTSFLSRYELNKTLGSHKVRIGLTESFYNVDHFRSDRVFLYQEVAANPKQLQRTGVTDKYGNYAYNSGAEYHNGWENKLALYFTDNWKVSDKFDLSYGVNLQYQKMKGDYSLKSRGDIALNDYDFTSFDHDWYHLNASLKAVYKLTKNFGLMGEFLYQEKHGQLENYSGAYTPEFSKTKSPMLAGGVYYNNNWLSVVSQITHLTRNNYQTRLTLLNPEDASESITQSVHYDIETLGWTTDVVLRPFKNFNVHYLLTVQDPQYKNYNFTAHFAGTNTDVDVNYNGNTVVEISKILMEIDPSYTYKKFNIGMNFRYFSKQYANLTNVLFFKPHWESFITAGYQYNEHLNFGMTVVNPLNQSGAKGTIYGTELATDASAYYGNIVTGSYIRPLTFEFSMNFRF
jgi:hypothetical protein